MVDFVLGRDRSAPVSFAAFSDAWREDALVRGGRASNTPALGPGDEHRFDPTMEIPEGWPEGRFHLCAVVDPGRKVDEGDESNNVACHPLNVERATSGGEATFDYSALTRRRYRVGPAMIYKLTLDPPPPARMREEQKVTIRFRYRFEPGTSGNIWMRPILSGAAGRCSYGASGSKSLSGSGTGTQSFSLRGGGCSGARIEAIVMKVGDRSGTVDETFPVDYRVP